MHLAPLFWRHRSDELITQCTVANDDKVCSWVLDRKECLEQVCGTFLLDELADEQKRYGIGWQAEIFTQLVAPGLECISGDRETVIIDRMWCMDKAGVIYAILLVVAAILIANVETAGGVPHDKARHERLFGFAKHTPFQLLMTPGVICT
jgi:hypothetical protein